MITTSASSTNSYPGIGRTTEPSSPPECERSSGAAATAMPRPSPDGYVPRMIMLYLLGQTSAALHARLGASGFDRRFGGLVAGKRCTLVFFHRAIDRAYAQGKQFYPGLQTGFLHIRDAVAALSDEGGERVLVIS